MPDKIQHSHILLIQLSYKRFERPHLKNIAFKDRHNNYFMHGSNLYMCFTSIKHRKHTFYSDCDFLWGTFTIMTAGSARKSRSATRKITHTHTQQNRTMVRMNGSSPGWNTKLFTNHAPNSKSLCASVRLCGRLALYKVGAIQCIPRP